MNGKALDALSLLEDCDTLLKAIAVGLESFILLLW